MKARFDRGWRLVLALPLLGAYGVQGCTADALRTAADALEDRADEIDDDGTDLGDWLADEIEDW